MEHDGSDQSGFAKPGLSTGFTNVFATMNFVSLESEHHKQYR